MDNIFNRYYPASMKYLKVMLSAIRYPLSAIRYPLSAIRYPLSASIIIFLLYQLPIFNLFAGLLDEGFLLYNAHLIAQGQIPYRDFFLTTTPGSYYVVAFLLKYVGNYMIMTRILGLVSGILILVISNKLFTLKKYWQYLYLLSLSFLLVAPARFFFYNEAVLLSMIALYFLIKGTEKNNLRLLVISGLFSGICFIFKQSVGGLLFPACILGIFLILNKKLVLKATLSYLLGGTIILLPATALLYFNNALPQAIYFIFSFANAVKSHQSSFLLHRIIAAPAITLFLILLIRSGLRQRLLLISIAVLPALLYLVSNTQRIGRLVTYLPDPIFYIQAFAFMFPLIVLAFSLKKKTNQQKNTVLSCIIYLVIFLSIAASGYSAGPAVVIAPLFIPLFIYFSQTYLSKIVRNKNVLLSLIVLIIVIYTGLFAYNPLRLQDPVFGGYNESHYTAQLDIQEAKYIRFPPVVASDLNQVISYIKNNTKPSEKIFCFPYCPGLLYFSERNGGAFYNLFWFETFMAKDQDTVINTLKGNNVRIVVLEKSKEDDMLKNMILAEDKRLPKIKDYITKNYHIVQDNSNFTILRSD